MSDISTGHIYIITCTQNPNIYYIGSTFNQLRHRWKGHKANFKAYMNGKKKISCSIFKHFETYGIKNFNINLIKSYKVIRTNNKDSKHLMMYEQLWMNKFKKCCNEQKAFNPLCYDKTIISDQHRASYHRNKNPEKQKAYREANKNLEQRRVYREQNKEKIKEQERASYEKNKEQRLEKQKANYEKNKTHILEKQKAYNEANREKISERRRANREKNREKINEQRRANREKNREKINEQQRALYHRNKNK